MGPVRDLVAAITRRSPPGSGVPTLLLVICLLIASLAAAAPLADATGGEWDKAYGDQSPEWTPPPQPPGVDLSPREYITMWSGMKTIDGNLSTAFSDANYTKRELLYLATARHDFTSPVPPTEAIRWNRGTAVTFDDRGRNTSLHPPGTELTDGEYIKDAYLRIAGPSPATRLHTADGVRLLVPDSSGLVVATDFRVDGPTDYYGSRVRRIYRLSQLTSSRIHITAAGQDITAETTDRVGGAYIQYAHLPFKSGEIKVNKSYRGVWTEEVYHNVCVEEENGTCVDREWKQVATNYVNETVTVADTITVQQRSGQGRIALRRTPNGVYLRTTSAQAWSGLTVTAAGGRSHLSSEIAFFTMRNRSWDTFVSSTEDGTSAPFRHEFTPVQTHAYPATAGASVINTKPNDLALCLINETTGPARPYPAQPPGVNVSTTTWRSTYRDARTATVFTRYSGRLQSGSDLRYRPLVRTGRFDGRVERYPPATRPNLTLSVTPIYVDNQTAPTAYVLTIRLSTPAGEPIATTGTNRRLRVNGNRTVNTNASGIARVRFDTAGRVPTAYTVRYVPAGPFEHQHYYLETSASAVPPVQDAYITPFIAWVLDTIIIPLFVLTAPLILVIAIGYLAVRGRLPLTGLG